MILESLFMIIGFVLLVKGADFLITGSSNIAKKFKISEMIIALTIVSIGTSLPELVISVTSALKGNAELSLGNVIGSNICNLLLVLGLTSIIKPIKINNVEDIPFILAYIIFFAAILDFGQRISRMNGVLLIIFFIVFLLYTIFMEKRKINKNQEVKNLESISENNLKNNKFNLYKNIGWIILGIIGLKFGGDFVVDNAVKIANRLNISSKIIGLTVVAIGTSLPELTTSITASLKGKSDIAIGNVLGSSIFNFFLIIGVTSIIKPLNYYANYNYEMLLLIVSNFILFIFAQKKNKITKINGVIYLLLYFVYVIKLFEIF